jgi:polyisoprenoid-binding protein YceI
MKPFALLLSIALLQTGCRSDALQSGDRSIAGKSAASEILPAPTTIGIVAISPKSAKIEFTGSTAIMSQSGWFEAFDGQIEMPSGRIEEAKIRVTVDMNSTSSNIGRLTKHLKADDFFNVAKYPTAEFESKSISVNRDGTAQITGVMTIHGTTNPIAFPAKFQVENDIVTFDAKITVKQTDYGMTESARSTKDEVPIHITIRGRWR